MSKIKVLVIQFKHRDLLCSTFCIIVYSFMVLFNAYFMAAVAVCMCNIYLVIKFYFKVYFIRRMDYPCRKSILENFDHTVEDVKLK